MLNKLFSRSKNIDSSTEKRTGNFREVPEEDMERYEFQDLLFRIIFSTETALHNEEDPMEIAIGVMKAACELYDADWCGILIADLQTQIFIPEIWYEVGLGPMKETLFNEVEFTEDFVTWLQHLMDQEPLVIPDIEAIRETNPKEYAAYKRLDARSIVGVPFGQHPLGFMVVRNVKRYAEHYEPLQLACFVAMMMLEQIRCARMESLFNAEEEKEDGKFHIRYNILGPHNMVIKGHEITEQDLKNPNRRAWVIMLYMVLHRLPVDQLKMIEDIWPDEEINTSRNNIRQAIFRMHNDLAAYRDVKVIDTRNRMMSFSDDVKITTDAQEMENLYQEACKMPDSKEKLFVLEKEFFLYRSRLFIQGDADVGNWLYTYTSHYNQIFVDITSELLSILGHNKDYRCIMDFGPAALEIEPGIQVAYYWIIIAADNLDNSVAKDQFMKKASKELIEEEYERLQEMLELQKHKI